MTKIKRYRGAHMNFKAIQFKDDPETVEVISNWFAEHGIKETRIDYTDERPFLRVRVDKERHIFTKAYIGDFVTLNQWGQFYSYNKEMFQQAFQPVKE